MMTLLAPVREGPRGHEFANKASNSERQVYFAFDINLVVCQMFDILISKGSRIFQGELCF